MTNDYGPWLSKLQDFQDDLERLLGREVDLLSRRAVERSSNYLLRRRILANTKFVYES